MGVKCSLTASSERQTQQDFKVSMFSLSLWFRWGVIVKFVAFFPFSHIFLKIFEMFVGFEPVWLLICPTSIVNGLIFLDPSDIIWWMVSYSFIIFLLPMLIHCWEKARDQSTSRRPNKFGMIGFNPLHLLISLSFVFSIGLALFTRVIRFFLWGVSSHVPFYCVFNFLSNFCTGYHNFLLDKWLSDFLHHLFHLSL